MRPRKPSRRERRQSASRPFRSRKSAWIVSIGVDLGRARRKQGVDAGDFVRLGPGAVGVAVGGRAERGGEILAAPGQCGEPGMGGT